MTSPKICFVDQRVVRRTRSRVDVDACINTSLSSCRLIDISSAYTRVFSRTIQAFLYIYIHCVVQYRWSVADSRRAETLSDGERLSVQSPISGR